jgi:hypothetical protein
VPVLGADTFRAELKKRDLSSTDNAV